LCYFSHTPYYYYYYYITSASGHADDVTILEGSVNTIKENAKALVVASKEIGLEANADKSPYMVMSRH
jgi:hypothetical protein